jgi:uncharacterized protein HemX
MTIDDLQQYWALVIASVLGLGIVLFVLFRASQDSRRGRLGSALTYMRDRERAAQAAAKVVEKATTKIERLRAKSDSVAPKQADAARDALLEAQELQKLIDDQLLIARNDVRMLITEEYPPKRHEAMRSKYLGESR